MPFDVKEYHPRPEEGDEECLQYLEYRLMQAVRLLACRLELTQQQFEVRHDSVRELRIGALPPAPVNKVAKAANCRVRLVPEPLDTFPRRPQEGAEVRGTGAPCRRERAELKAAPVRPLDVARHLYRPAAARPQCLTQGHCFGRQRNQFHPPQYDEGSGAGLSVE